MTIRRPRQGYMTALGGTRRAPGEEERRGLAAARFRPFMIENEPVIDVYMAHRGPHLVRAPWRWKLANRCSSPRVDGQEGHWSIPARMSPPQKGASRAPAHRDPHRSERRWEHCAHEDKVFDSRWMLGLKDVSSPSASNPTIHFTDRSSPFCFKYNEHVVTCNAVCPASCV